MNQAPNINTHIPVTTELPTEANDLASGRPDEPVPSLWQQAV